MNGLDSCFLRISFALAVSQLWPRSDLAPQYLFQDVLPFIFDDIPPFFIFNEQWQQLARCDHLSRGSFFLQFAFDLKEFCFELTTSADVTQQYSSSPEQIQTLSASNRSYPEFLRKVSSVWNPLERNLAQEPSRSAPGDSATTVS